MICTAGVSTGRVTRGQSRTRCDIGQLRRGMVFFYRSLRAQPSIPCYNTSVWAVQRAQYHNPTPHWTPDMISDVSYRSLETHRSPCDQRRTRGCTSDKKRAAGGYLVPQPSPTCLARTVQPASARPEPSLGLAAAAVVRLVPAGGASDGAGRRSRALRQAAAFTHTLVHAARRGGGHRRRPAHVCVVTCEAD